MINVSNHNTMHRHEPIIQLADHVKNKLKRHKHVTKASSFINSSDEFMEVNSDDEGDDNDFDSLHLTDPDNSTRPRRDTYTTYEVKKSSGSFFTDRTSSKNFDKSFLEETYKKQQECQECIRRDRIMYLQQQDLQRLYYQNKELKSQLHSSISLNHHYENNLEKFKSHLTKVNSNLYEYQINFDDLKQKIVFDKKANPKIAEKEVEEEEEQQEEEDTADHIKRLRYEIQMYNRIVAAKEKEEKKQQNQVDFLF